jgi:hypothetical protein
MQSEGNDAIGIRGVSSSEGIEAMAGRGAVIAPTLWAMMGIAIYGVH